MKLLFFLKPISFLTLAFWPLTLFCLIIFFLVSPVRKFILSTLILKNDNLHESFSWDSNYLPCVFKSYLVCSKYCYPSFLSFFSSICMKYLFPPLHFSICVYLLIWSGSCIHSATLYLLIGAFSPFPFNVIIDNYILSFY